jgi:hypothetical protein
MFKMSGSHDSAPVFNELFCFVCFQVGSKCFRKSLGIMKTSALLQEFYASIALLIEIQRGTLLISLITKSMAIFLFIVRITTF